MTKPKSKVKPESIKNPLAKNSVRPGTPGLNRKDGPIDLTTAEASKTESDNAEDSCAKCCVCDKYEPDELITHDEVYSVN